MRLGPNALLDEVTQETSVRRLRHLSAERAEVIHGVQAVFVAAAPIAAIALIVVLPLREVPLQGRASDARVPAVGR